MLKYPNRTHEMIHEGPDGKQDFSQSTLRIILSNDFLFAGRVASFLETCANGTFSLKMEGIFFQRILSRIICCYQHFQVFLAYLDLLVFNSSSQG